MPVVSITPEEAADYFGWLANLAQTDLSASSKLTRQQLGWDPTGPDLLTDLRNMITPWPRVGRLRRMRALGRYCERLQSMD